MKGIIALFIIFFVIKFLTFLIKIFKLGLETPNLINKLRNLENEKENLKRNHWNEIEKLEKTFKNEKTKLINDYEIYITGLKYEKETKLIEAKERVLKLELEIKKDLVNYKLNNTMKILYNDFFEKGIKKMENHFLYKKHPSLKSAQLLSEIKEDYKRLQIENKELNLLLSEFIPDEEEISILKVKEKSSFDNELTAYKYGKLSKEQWNKLTYVEKLDIVLEKYRNSWKDKLNIGLEFERYCGYLYEKKGYQVKYWGILNGKADGGIDLIAKNKTKILYIQCKYWKTSKLIRENTIAQLFGSALKMAIDNGETYDSFIKKVETQQIRIILLTKTEISEEAKEFCKKLNVIYQEKIEIAPDYPRVKLVYGEDKIFYIPTDLQYDNIIFSSTNKEYSRSYTCKEAEKLGYRHCFKWRGND